jgi:hypothetical protein
VLLALPSQRPGPMSARGAGLLVALLVIAAARASAQAPTAGGRTGAPEATAEMSGRRSSSRWEWGGSLLKAEPVGQFAEHVAGGGGFGLSALRYFGASRSFGVRLDLTLLSYGKTSHSHRVILSGTAVDVDVTTDNTIAGFAIGPHVVFGQGRVRPYLGGSVGSAQFVTTTAGWAGGQPLPISTTNHLERDALALTTGGGVRFVFREQRAHPIALELDGRYRLHGSVEYLHEGGLRELPNGSVELDPIVSDANLWTVSVGVLLGAR